MFKKRFLKFQPPASKVNYLKNSIIFSFLFHLTIFTSLYIFKEDIPRESYFEVKLSPPPKNIKKRKISKVISRKSLPKQKLKNNFTSLSKKSKSHLEEKFEKDFEKILFNPKKNSQINLYVSKNKSKSWEKETEKSFPIEKKRSDEKIKTPLDSTSRSEIRWHGNSKRKALYLPKPSYPKYYRQKGIQGEVLLLVEISSKGEVIQVQVLKSSGYPKLDILAKNAARKAKFSFRSSQYRNQVDIGEIKYSFTLVR